MSTRQILPYSFWKNWYFCAEPTKAHMGIHFRLQNGKVVFVEMLNGMLSGVCVRNGFIRSETSNYHRSSLNGKWSVNTVGRLAVPRRTGFGLENSHSIGFCPTSYHSTKRSKIVPFRRGTAISPTVLSDIFPFNVHPQKCYRAERMNPFPTNIYCQIPICRSRSRLTRRPARPCIR